MAESIIALIQKSSWILILIILLFGWSNGWLMVAAFICMIAPVVFSFSFGRAWCGNFCPRNSFSKVVLSRIAPENGHIPAFFRSTAFRLLMFVLLMTLFGTNLYLANWTLKGVGYAFLKMMLITTVMQVSFGVFLHPYAWCSFCPMGTAAFIISKIRKNNIPNIKIGQNCVGCKVCEKSCPLELKISRWKDKGEIGDADCMKCRLCVKKCPQKALAWYE